MPNSGPAREKRSSALPRASGFPSHAGSAPPPTRLRAAHVGFEPREQAVERAPAFRFGGETNLAVGQRRDGAVAQHRDQRQDRQRDQNLEQRETGAARTKGPHRCGGCPT
jgi:hypothetical protein